MVLRVVLERGRPFFVAARKMMWWQSTTTRFLIGDQSANSLATPRQHLRRLVPVVGGNHFISPPLDTMISPPPRISPPLETAPELILHSGLRSNHGLHALDYTHKIGNVAKGAAWYLTAPVPDQSPVH